MAIQLTNLAQLDKTFAEDGIFTAPPSEGIKNIIPRFLTLGPSGDAYFLCSVQDLENRSLYACFHLNEHGQFDEDFGGNGYVVGSFDGSESSISNSSQQILLVDIDGSKRILLVGFFLAPGAGWRSSLVRLHLNGEMDTAFGEGGIRIIDLPPDNAQGISALASAQTPHSADTGRTQLSSLPDNRILLIQEGKNFDYINVLNSDGSPDTNFNGSGFFEAKPKDARNVFLWSLMRTAKGKFVGAGVVETLPISTQKALFVQLDDKGELDTSFGDGGYVLIGGEYADYQIRDLVTQPNERILGIGISVGVRGLLISREPDGTPNIQFNGGEPLDTILDQGKTNWLSGKVLGNGTFLVAGRAGDELDPLISGNVVVARFLNNGALDTSFGNGTGYWRFADTTGLAVLPLAFMEGKVLFITWTKSNFVRVMRGLIPDAGPAQ